MLNPLADNASVGDTVLAVWVISPGKVANFFSALPGFGATGVTGSASAVVDPATAANYITTGIGNVQGLTPAEAPSVYVSKAGSVYIGCSLTVNAQGDGINYDSLLGPLGNLTPFLTTTTGPILAFVDYGDSGESSGPLAQTAANADDSGQTSGGSLTPVALVTGIEDGINAIGPIAPYFLNVYGSSGLGPTTVTAGIASGGALGSQTATTSAANSAIGATANTAQQVGQAVQQGAQVATLSIGAIILALVVVELLFNKKVSEVLA
jgi:hypothetical protein